MPAVSRGGTAYVSKGDRAMLIDTEGRVRTSLKLDPKVSYVGSFSEGLADVLVKRRESTASGFIDERGEWAIPLEYDRVDPFSGGLARVAKGPITGYINRQGEFVWKTATWGPW